MDDCPELSFGFGNEGFGVVGCSKQRLGGAIFHKHKLFGMLKMPQNLSSARRQNVN